MNFFLADDSRQSKPSRPGMGPLVCIGGLVVQDTKLNELERAIENLCKNFGFPLREQFKWSPGKELWMRDNLVGDHRQNFFTSLLSLIKESSGEAIVIVEDTTCRCATPTQCAEEDIVRLFLERVQWNLIRNSSNGIVIADRPGGGRSEEDKFLLQCLETLQTGTKYIIPDRIVLSVLSASPKFVRLLQSADVITGCSLAFISGEDAYSPPIFDYVRSLLDSDGIRSSGIGLKIHPDFKYVNLYHWLLGESHFYKLNLGHPLPIKNMPYSEGSMIY
jgi:hypothetical protein